MCILFLKSMGLSVGMLWNILCNFIPHPPPQCSWTKDLFELCFFLGGDTCLLCGFDKETSSFSCIGLRQVFRSPVSWMAPFLPGLLLQETSSASCWSKATSLRAEGSCTPDTPEQHPHGEPLQSASLVLFLRVFSGWRRAQRDLQLGPAWMAGKAGVTKIRGPLEGSFGGRAWWAMAQVARGLRWYSGLHGPLEAM